MASGAVLKGGRENRRGQEWWRKVGERMGEEGKVSVRRREKKMKRGERNR